MATRQLVKPTSTNNATTQVTLTQSREMVKTLLFVSVGIKHIADGVLRANQHSS